MKERTGWFAQRTSIGANPAKQHYYEEGISLCGRGGWVGSMRQVRLPGYWGCLLCMKKRNQVPRRHGVWEEVGL